MTLTVRIDDPTRPASVTCWYRRVNQAERFQSIEMEREGQAFHTIIPASYTASPYPLQYYFLVRLARDRATIVPGFARDVLDQPYIVVSAVEQQ